VDENLLKSSVIKSSNINDEVYSPLRQYGQYSDMCRLLFRNCNLQLFVSYTANYGHRHQAGFNSKMFLKVPTVRRRSLVLFFGVHNSFRHFLIIEPLILGLYVKSCNG